MRPIIGITTFKTNEKRATYVSVADNYVNSIICAGGTPLLIPTNNNLKMITEYLRIIDGLMITGGEDILPLYYGENPIQEITKMDCERDEWEYNLVKQAYDIDLPVLGICRGNQLINVILGGTLYQNIQRQVPDANGHFFTDTPMKFLTHKVKLEEDSKLFKIFNKTEINVNSFHNQAIKDIAKNFKVTATAEDGIVEGIEDKTKTFFVGIQWHPEALVKDHPEFLKIFKTFVDICWKQNLRHSSINNSAI